MEISTPAVLTALPSTLADPVRLFHGTAVERREWSALPPLGRRQLVVRARAATLQADGVVSHRSAAALWGLPDHGRPDWRLHVIDRRATKTHSGRGVVRHAGRLADDEVVVLDGLRTTSLLRTVVDLAHTSTFTLAVVVLDHVLHGGHLDHATLASALADRRGRRGSRRAASALAFADAAAESPGESISRVTLRQLGAAPPVLQQEFATDAGLFRVDFWWPGSGVIGEFDGRVKYDDRDGLWTEKRREDALRRSREVRGFARWGMAEAEDPGRLAAVLVTAGLPVRRGWAQRGS
ncbi:hypothetical protein [Curtobacterium sp. MCBD17_032]|uniref:hypothetical protein n=1 Tax=Curtobacterium sp. MCBD17_032 TaxID=2175659 RepID=UPI000DA8DB66|nr:hypothetical protein [Curtobacterium sp. MCBD17_032]PZE82758.1 hypothetical protein DEI91_11290 [Curtobacterium sp. MCBD17_032]